jgi:hypothetical protein
MEFGEGVHRWWCQDHLLDERSLAAIRIGLSSSTPWEHPCFSWKRSVWEIRPGHRGVSTSKSRRPSCDCEGSCYFTPLAPI